MGWAGECSSPLPGYFHSFNHHNFFMKSRTLQILVFVCLFIATWCRARSFPMDIIGDGKLLRDPSWEPWATLWYVFAAILQVLAVALSRVVRAIIEAH